MVVSCSVHGYRVTQKMKEKGEDQPAVLLQHQVLTVWSIQWPTQERWIMESYKCIVLKISKTKNTLKFMHQRLNFILFYFQLSQQLSEGSLREEPSPGRGRYDERYITLQSIGKGAFGFVKVGQRRSDGVKVSILFLF